MDIKVIVEKALKGEDYSVDVKDATPEELSQVHLAIKDAASAASKQELEKIAARRQELERLNKKNLEESDFSKKFQNEQLQKAREKFFSNPDYQMTDEQKKDFNDNFKTDKIDADMIMSDMKKYYVAQNPDAFIEAKKKTLEFEKNAAQFIAGQAGGNNIISAPDAEKYSKEAKELFASWHKIGITNKTLEDAEKQVKKGPNWKERKLSE